ncbi:MAG TPA: histidine phosphatase family protein [Steroidobacteraceae bacterium]|nr:histidine phosphatase family protein [Steroidobacteraceae bacterium]
MKSERASLQHRPFLIPIWLTAIAAVAAAVVFGLAVFAAWTWFTANSTTVIVIRHAEKDTVAAADPALSAAGEARAALLARMFGDAKGAGRLDAIYVSATLRSRSTAAPLAARLGIAPVVVAADDPQGLARRVLRENSGRRVMVIGHINTVPEIVSALADRSDISSIDEQDFATMYVVSVPRIGHANLVRLSY